MNQATGGMTPVGTTSQRPPGAPGGIVLPGGTWDNPLAIGRSAQPPVVTLPLSNLRQVSIHNLEAGVRSTAPVSVVAEVDVSRLQAARDYLKPQVEAMTGIPLTYTPFFVRATVQALQAYPIMNSMMTPQGFVIPRTVNIGIATQVPGGVLLPTIFRAETKSIMDLARELHSISERAPRGQISQQEMSGHTFCMTNPGRYGQTIFGTPIIKPPNVGILAFEAIKKRPVVLENDQILSRPMMYIVLTADHRAVDGAEMIGFTGKVKEILENLSFT